MEPTGSNRPDDAELERLIHAGRTADTGQHWSAVYTLAYVELACDCHRGADGAYLVEITASRLGDALNRTPATAGRILRTLTRRGWLEKLRQGRRGKASIYRLTPPGQDGGR